MMIIGRHFLISSVNPDTFIGFSCMYEKRGDKDFIDSNETWMTNGYKFMRIIAQSRRGKKKTNGNIKHT